jgi:CheY-like chemotaxis protein
MCQAYIIDDDPVYIYITETLIKEYQIFESYKTYTNPVNALIDLLDAYYSSEKLPEIILLDLNMPKLSGWNFLDSFNSIATLDRPTTSVYIVTYSIDPFDKQRAMLYSCVKGFLSKPASFDMLKGLAVC